MTEASIKTRPDTVPATTNSGIPLLDPTINVQNLLAAAVVRLNDLAAAEQMRVNERTTADMLRVDQLREAETRRINEQIAAERRRVDEQLALREHYEEALRQAEAKRIDANRAGDAAAVATANERANQTAAVLASQMSTMVENTRALVDTNSKTSSQQLYAAINPLAERITNLEKTSYEGSGREKFSDPAMQRLADQVALLVSGAATGSGKGIGSAQTILYLVMAVTVISTIISILAFVVK